MRGCCWTRTRSPPDGTVAVTTASVSPDGALLAYGVADGGSDWRTIRVRDVATGEDLADEIPWTRWNSPVWLPGDRSAPSERQSVGFVREMP